MTNPVVHTLAFILAIIIPGGLGVYFTWRFLRNKRNKEQAVKQLSPDKVKEAFLRRYPKESLRAKSRAERISKLNLYKTRPRKKSQ
jgi:hypothetical protein